MAEQSYVERPPLPALRELVSSVWVQRVAPDAPPYRQRNIPNGAIDLLCRPGSLPLVVGPLTSPRSFPTRTFQCGRRPTTG